MNTPTPPFPQCVPVAPLPRNCVEALGYNGNSQIVTAHWEPGGDEVIVSAPECAFTGSPWPYLEIVNEMIYLALVRTFRAHGLNIYCLGSSDSEATHRLVLDRDQQHVFCAPAAACEEHLRQLTPVLPISDAHMADVLRIFEAALELQMDRVAGMIFCPICMGVGYPPAPAGGFDCCPICNGAGMIDPAVASTIVPASA
jgi:hypothetical protein